MSATIQEDPSKSHLSSVDIQPSTTSARLVRRHLLVGWIGLLFFLVAGIALEALHALKLDLYLDARQSTRRLMWTLGHAHGTLFSLVSLAWAWTITQLSGSRYLRPASWGIQGGIILLPAGFFLGGWGAQDGDPGLAIVLVPLGAGSMLFGVLIAACAVWTQSPGIGGTLLATEELKKSSKKGRSKVR